MLNKIDHLDCKYIPLLALRAAEMTALEQLPGKDKDRMLPLIRMRGWVGTKTLAKAIPRIEKAIGERSWIADIDEEFVQTANPDREGFNVIAALKELLNPAQGYKNWCQFLVTIPNAIPTLQIGDLDQLGPQIEKLRSYERGLVVRFSLSDIDSGKESSVLKTLNDRKIEDLLVLYDYGQVKSDILTFAGGIASRLDAARMSLPHASFALSATSFPSGFSGYHKGENPIYERLLFNNVKNAVGDGMLLYSDRAGVRAKGNSGGGGTPSPRIDYPLANDWRFVRKEFEDRNNVEKQEKARLYTEAAQQIMRQEYWNPDLHVWGTQVIELTSQSDMLGISSPPKATAVRLNIHMHTQLYYNEPENLLDTDEDWED